MLMLTMLTRNYVCTQLLQLLATEKPLCSLTCDAPARPCAEAAWRCLAQSPLHTRLQPHL